jgi:transloator
MPEINSLNSAAVQQNLAAENMKLLGANTEKAKEIIGKTVEILSGTNVRVSQGGTTGVDGNNNRITGATGAPALDDPGDVKNVEANLEKLIAYLQLESEEQQADAAKERIENQKARLDTEHKDRMAKIDESLKKIDDAEKSRKVSRFFSWLSAIFSVIAAVIVTAVTGGAAAGFAIAGAALAVGSLIGEETGLTDKLTEKIAESLQKSGMSKNDAQMKAALIVNLTIMGLGLICSAGAMVSAFKAGADTVKNIGTLMKTVQNISTIANTAVGIGGMVSGGVSTAMNYRAESSKAEVTELQKFLTMMQQQLEDSEEELQNLLQLIQQSVGKIAELIASATDTSGEIAKNIGAMA